MREPVAIIDIGSNSIRLVVYTGSPRAPSVIFNEKVLAGLGRDLAKTGALSEAAQTRALTALGRFQLLLRHMGVGRVRTVATAAVRDASNGADFVAQVEALGLDCEVLSAEQEGWLAGEGVLSAIPDADGLVGDLGGGSLELVEVGDGRVRKALSLPIGVLRVRANSKDSELVADAIRRGLKTADISRRRAGRPFYMVGGSWRALARLDMVTSSYPLPITHGYVMPTNRPRDLAKLIESLQGKDTKGIPVSSERIPTLPAAAMILSSIAEEVRPDRFIVSSYGIREGLLYEGLPARERRKDPLVEAAREASLAARRFEEHGDLLDSWIGPIFGDQGDQARLRLVSCILADAAWQAHPDFRSERGVELALHGNWVGVDAAERVLIAQALYSNFGAQQLLPDRALTSLCNRSALERAHQWGLAMRLGQRLSGGVASALKRTSLATVPDCIQLRVRKSDQALIGEAVQRRLVRLAQAMGCEQQLVVSG